MKIKTVTDYMDKHPDFRAAVVSHIAKANRSKANPENMRRSPEHYKKMAAKRWADAGVIKAGEYQESKDAGIALEQIVGEE